MSKLYAKRTYRNQSNLTPGTKKDTSASNQIRQPVFRRGGSMSRENIAYLQRAVGNHATMRILQRHLDDNLQRTGTGTPIVVKGDEPTMHKGGYAKRYYADQGGILAIPDASGFKPGGFFMGTILSQIEEALDKYHSDARKGIPADQARSRWIGDYADFEYCYDQASRLRRKVASIISLIDQYIEKHRDDSSRTERVKYLQGIRRDADKEHESLLSYINQIIDLFNKKKRIDLL